jgi:hypothetical protein
MHAFMRAETGTYRLQTRRAIEAACMHARRCSACMRSRLPARARGCLLLRRLHARQGSLYAQMLTQPALQIDQTCIFQKYTKKCRGTACIRALLRQPAYARAQIKAACMRTDRGRQPACVPRLHAFMCAEAGAACIRAERYRGRLHAQPPRHRPCMHARQPACAPRHALACSLIAPRLPACMPAKYESCMCAEAAFMHAEASAKAPSICDGARRASQPYFRVWCGRF